MTKHGHSQLAYLAATILVTALVACAPGGEALDAALATITAEDLARHIRTLASDEFEGRGPSSPGEEKTIRYLREEFERMGLE
ncbi:MAG: peptidase M28, partial [Acidobacteriota bacterium]